MSDCWSDGLTGLATERRIDKIDGLMVGLMDGEGAGCMADCWNVRVSVVD